MEMTLRWFGTGHDTVTLRQIRQIPGVTGVITTLYDTEPGDFDWDRIFDGAEWFHFTGITPALGPNLVNICLDACKAAKTKGIKISCDLNYRNKLWTRQQAREAMTNFCCFSSSWVSHDFPA